MLRKYLLINIHAKINDATSIIDYALYKPNRSVVSFRVNRKIFSTSAHDSHKVIKMNWKINQVLLMIMTFFKYENLDTRWNPDKNRVDFLHNL